ncbi:MAG TPA: ATPase domain-containing protein [Tepidisphaeraceae bacterium]|nr:ATPase domain-containing protein [Tepidisphaeraceae bacterium]
MEQTKSVGRRVATGVAGLDAILSGGLPRDRLYLVQGDPGVGKTTLALQFLLEGQRVGETGLYVTLGETREELVDVAASHNWKLDGIDIFEISTGESEEGLRGEEESYDVFHPSEIELGEVMRTLIDEAKRVNATRVVIDSLSELRLLARDPLRFRRQMLALKHFFVGRGATVLLLDAISAEKIGDLQSNTLVHGVILLEQTVPPFGSKRRRLSVAKLRGVRFDDGYHDFKIETGGLRVFPRLIASVHTNGKPKDTASSGLPELDALLGGGLTRGSSTILMGPAGSGKSSIAGQFIAAAADRGEMGVAYIFDESVSTFCARSDGIGLGMHEKVADGRIKLVQVDPGELAPFEFAQLVRNSVEKDGAKFVVIDSLNGYMNATPDERFLVVQLHELLTYLGNKGVCTLIVVAQSGMLGPSMQNPVDASYLADSVVLFRYFEHAGHVLKAISVIKKRTGPHEVTIREFGVSNGRIRVGQPLKDFRGVMTGVPLYQGTGTSLTGESNEGRRGST